MHELSIAEALIKQVTAIASEHQATEIRSITVEIGVLSGVDPEALKWAFPIAAEDSVASGAELVLETEPAIVTCNDCGAATPVAHPAYLLCASCDSPQVTIDKGRNLLIQSIELCCSTDNKQRSR